MMHNLMPTGRRSRTTHSSENNEDTTKSRSAKERLLKFSSTSFEGDGEISEIFDEISLRDPLKLDQDILSCYPVIKCLLQFLPKKYWIKLRFVNSKLEGFIADQMKHLKTISPEWFEQLRRGRRRQFGNGSTLPETSWVSMSSLCLFSPLCRVEQGVRGDMKDQVEEMYTFFQRMCPNIEILPHKYEEVFQRLGGFEKLKVLNLDLDRQDTAVSVIDSLAARSASLRSISIKLTMLYSGRPIDLRKIISPQLLGNLRVLDLSKTSSRISCLFADTTFPKEFIPLEEISFPPTFYHGFESDLRTLGHIARIRKVTLPHFCEHIGKVEADHTFEHVPAMPYLQHLIIACWPDNLPIASWNEFFSCPANLSGLEIPLYCEISSNLVENLGRIKRLKQLQLYVPEQFTSSIVEYDPTSFRKCFLSSNLSSSLTELTTVFSSERYQNVLAAMNDNLKQLKKLEMTVQYTTISQDEEDIVQLKMPLETLSLIYVFNEVRGTVKLSLIADKSCSKNLKKFLLKSQPLTETRSTMVSPFRLNGEYLRDFVKNSQLLENLTVVNFNLSNESAEEILRQMFPRFRMHS